LRFPISSLRTVCIWVEKIDDRLTKKLKKIVWSIALAPACKNFTSLHWIGIPIETKFKIFCSGIKSGKLSRSSKVKQRLPQQTKGSKVLSSCVIRYDQKNHQRPILQTIREFYKPLKTYSTNHRAFYKQSEYSTQTIRAFYIQTITNQFYEISQDIHMYVCKSYEAVFTTKQQLCNALINNKNSAFVQSLKRCYL
jgi:hypothetical protein